MFTVGKSPSLWGKTKENSKLNKGGFNKWLEILAGKDLQTRLRKSETSTLNSAQVTAQRRQTLSTRAKGYTATTNM